MDNHIKTASVLVVGQIYVDTLLHVPHFPAEDTKLRATHMEQRLGGNCTNTSTVLAQFPSTTVACMSAVGEEETAGPMLAQLQAKHINTSLCLYRPSPTPSSYIIQNEQQGSRTIISHTSVQDISCNEFIQMYTGAAANANAVVTANANANTTTATTATTATTNTNTNTTTNTSPFSWVHFEGRNIDQVIQQIDWLNSHPHYHPTVSVEIEKPERQGIDTLLSKGDVVFFSKLVAQHKGFTSAEDFLQFIHQQCKPNAILFCSWGDQGAACRDATGTLHIQTVPLPVTVVDTVGAGDTFIAAAIHGLSQGQSASSALTLACRTATWKVVQAGFDGLVKDVGE